MEKGKKLFYWIFPLGWMGIIFYASSQPYEEQDLKPALHKGGNLSALQPYLDWISFHYHGMEVSVEQLGTAGFIEFFIRKGAHLGAYAVLFLLLVFALSKTVTIIFSKLISISFLITVLYAWSDEFHQGFTPNRTPYAGDVVLDSIGAVLGLFILHLANFLGLCRRHSGNYKS